MTPSAKFPGYRERYLPAMKSSEIARLHDKQWAPVIVTTGAIEQHGPHLPVSVDAQMGQVWITHILARLPADVSCYVAPAITIGKSNEHVGFPGTLAISKSTLRELLLAISRQVAAWGFRQLAIINTHGGNLSVIRYTLNEIRETFRIRADLVRPKVNLGLSEQEATYGFHAGEVETSWMLAVAEPLVKMASAGCEYPAHIEDKGELRPEASPATFSWATKDLSRSGVMGNARAATAEKGRRWIEQMADAYAQHISELHANGKELAGRG